MSKAIIEKYLKRYILNYKPELFKMKVLKGRLTFKNLILNTHTINEDFDSMNLPLKLEFGLIKQLTVDVSILKVCLEEIIVDGVTIVLSPDPSKADRNFDIPDDKRIQLIEELLLKFRNYEKWADEVTKLQKMIDDGEDIKNNSIHAQLFKTIKGYSQKRCSSVPSSQYKIMDQEELSHVEAFQENGELIYKTEEEEKESLEWTFEQIKANLSAKIIIKGVRVYYQHTVDKEMQKEFDHCQTPVMMIMCISFDSLVLSQVDYLDCRN